MKNQKLTPKELHRQASIHFQNALVCRVEGNKEDENKLLKEAFKLESECFLMLADRSDLEPTRTIIFDSLKSIGKRLIKLNEVDFNQFLKNTFESWKQKFPEIQIEWKQNDFTGTYVVKVLPESVYDSDEFLELLDLFDKEFEKSFIDDEIYFVTGDDSYHEPFTHKF